MDDYTVSLLVVNYNKEKYLVDRCLKSINNQTYENIKLIFIENGSTHIVYTEEDLKKIVTNLKYKYIKIKQNHGYPGGMNVALANIDTDFYMDVDSDDYVESTLVKKMIECYKKTNSEMIFCKHDIVYLNDNKVDNIISNNSENLTMNSIKLIPSMLDWNHIYKNNFVSEDLATPWAILYKSQKLKNIRIDSKYNTGMYSDFDYTISCIRKINKVSYLDEVLYHLNRGMLSNSNPGKKSKLLAMDTFLAIKNIYNNINDLNDKEINLAFNRFIINKFDIISKNLSYGDFKKIYNEITKCNFFSAYKKYKPKNYKTKFKKYIFIYFPYIFYKVNNCK